MNATAAALSGLKRQRPEWSQWVDVIADVLDEAEASCWDDLVPYLTGPRSGNTPRLRGVTVSMDADVVARLLTRLLQSARQVDTAEMATLTRVTRAQLDAVDLFRAALCIDTAAIDRVADRCGADAGALHAVLALLPIPFLQACHRAWAPSIESVSGTSSCPICGAWPAFVELRGIERGRYHRCSRCGSAWRTHALSCPYCQNVDHHSLASLVPGESGSPGSVDACTRCRGYVKVFTRLQGCPPLHVIIEDIRGVALDIAALESGYLRPAGPGCALNLAVRPVTRPH